MTLTGKQTALLIGGLLGDLHIQKTPSNSGKCRLRFCHSIKQKDYVDYKHRVFKEDLCSTTKEPYVESKKRDTNSLFYTSYSLAFAEPYKAWYEADSKDGAPPVKRVPLNISELLIDPLALAIWYLDDGTRRGDTASCRIATQSFSEEENI